MSYLRKKKNIYYLLGKRYMQQRKSFIIYANSNAQTVKLESTQQQHEKYKKNGYQDILAWSFDFFEILIFLTFNETFLAITLQFLLRYIVIYNFFG